MSHKKTCTVVRILASDAEQENYLRASLMTEHPKTDVTTEAAR
ncbi:MAG: hypothetical protein ACXADS_06930 [Candidatus Thorarchaeota archaeon]